MLTLMAGDTEIKPVLCGLTENDFKRMVIDIGPRCILGMNSLPFIHSISYGTISS